MWKRAKTTGPTTNRRCFSLVHQYIQRFNEVSGSKSAVIRRRSKTPGVMITQNTANIPEGKSTPDFQSRPLPLTIKEGQLAVFKVVVKGDPKPEVTWKRAKGPISDKDKFQSKYDESTGEHVLEIIKVSGAETDTYKCYAANEYGKAVCTMTLNVTEANPSDFRKLLRKSKVEEKAEGEADERFWDAMMNADRKDYERICTEFGVADLHLIRKKLEQKKKERAQKKCKDGGIPYDEDATEKHSLRSAVRTKNSNIEGLMQKGPGLDQVDEKGNLLHTGLNLVDEEATLLSTEFKLSNVDFVIKIQELKAQEREDALFTCVLTHPLPKITWMGKGSVLEDGEKYSINVSDHKLIHRLLIKDCHKQDKGIYSAVAGITSCSAWLVVQVESDPASAGMKRARKTTLAGGAQIDFEKVAREQQIKNREEMEKILAAVKARHGEGQPKVGKSLTTSGRDGERGEVTGPGKNSRAAKNGALSEPTGSKAKSKIKISRGDGTETLDASGCVTQAGAQLIADDPKKKKHIRFSQADFDKVTDTNEDGYYEEKEDFTGSANNSRYIKNGQETKHVQTESSGRSDDVEFNQIQTFATSQNEVAGPDGNKDSTGSIRRPRHTRTVQRKQHRLTSEQDPNGLAGDDEGRYDEASGDEARGDEGRYDEGRYDEASGDEARGDEGRYDEGRYDKARADEARGDEGRYDKARGDEGRYDEGRYDKARGDEGRYDEGRYDKARADEARGDEGRYDKARGDEARGDEGRYDEGRYDKARGDEARGNEGRYDKAKGDKGRYDEGSGDEANESDENEDPNAQVKHSRCSKKRQKPQKAVNEQDPNGLAGDDEGRYDEARGDKGRYDEGRYDEARADEARGDKGRYDEARADETRGDERRYDEGRYDVARGDEARGDERRYDEGSGDEGRYDKANDSDENEDPNGQVKHSRCSKKRQKPQKAVNGESTRPEDHNECDETEDATGAATHSKRKRHGSLIEDVVIDPGVHFICGLSDVNAIINESAELTCKLSSADCEGVWFRDGKKISPDDNFSVTKDGVIHKLVIIRCKEEHSGKYRLEADGRKTEAIINVKDPPRFDPEDLSAFSEPVTVKVGHNVILKLHFVGHEPIKTRWYREGEELLDDNNTKIEKSASHSRLLLSRCQRKDTGEIKIKLKNEDGFIEAISQLIVLDKPTPPLGPAEVTESSAICVEFRWRPPKDDGGSPVINYIMERQQVGRNTWKKIGEIPGVPSYRDTDVDHGRKYCYRIRAVTAEGTSEVMETEEMQAGTLAFPGPPAPPKVVSAYDDCINVSWASPSNTGGSRILGYILEKRKKGSNLWVVVNAIDELIKEKKYAVKDVVSGMEYEFRVTALNLSGVGEFSNASEFVFARDPKQPPGKVTSLRVTETSYSHLVLTWTKPEDRPGIQDEAKGYFVEIRPAECIEWSRSNTTLIITTSFSVKGLKPKGMYWVRVIAINDGGESAPEELANYVLAMPSPVRPKFTNHKMKSFLVVRAGNSVRITVNFEASPRPHIIWLKDNVPVTKRVTVSNSDESSQLLIPTSERSDSGIYSILVKNLAGQETFSTEVRVTDDPKPPGPVELDENVPGTVTVIWQPSPDEKRDDRLHYTVSKLDCTKRTWTTVADRLFNNKFTVCNIMHGREYHFRVYAKNDMGVSAPSESPTCWTEKKKKKFVVSVPTRKDCDLRCAPTFIVPLKLHNAPKGYECYMSCAVKGNPQPRITWYRNHISLNTDANYYISNVCGVCSMSILHVGPKDMGEYSITAENALGRAECSTVLSVRE